MEGGIDIQKDGFRGALKKGYANTQETAAAKADEPMLADNEALKNQAGGVQNTVVSHGQDVIDKHTTTTRESHCIFTDYNI